MIAAIGKVVYRTRTRLGWTTARLANEAGTPSAVIEGLEAGHPGVTTVQLGALARALAIDPVALRRGEEVGRPAPSVYLRHRGMQDFHDSDTPILDQAAEQARTLNELGDLLGVSRTPWIGRATDAPRDRPDAAAKDGYQLATDVRKHLGEPTRPFDDLREVVEASLGVIVLVRSLSSRAACAIKAGNAAAIVLDAAAYAGRPIRARGAIAHELSHLLHDPDDAGVHVVLDREYDRSTEANEQRARAHAAELLLPRAGLQGLLGLPRAVEETSVAVDLVARAMDHFGTTWEMTANHLCNRGFVARDLRVWLESAHGHAALPNWPMVLPAAGAPSVLVAERTRRAHEEGLLTDSEARSILALDVVDPLPWDRDR